MQTARNHNGLSMGSIPKANATCASIINHVCLRLMGFSNTWL